MDKVPRHLSHTPTCVHGAKEHAEPSSGCVRRQPVINGDSAEGRTFAYDILHDGDRVEMGSVSLCAIATPGHTPEHLCYLIAGGKGATAPWGVFTGDALFAGDVGRTDLLGKDHEAQSARLLHRSLFQRLLPLGDELVIYPAHGKGSPCGGDIGDREASTLGYERRHNPKLQVATEDEFVRDAVAGREPVPFHYPRLKVVNSVGANPRGDLPQLMPLTAHEFQEAAARPHARVVDLREIEAFASAHIRGALNIPLREEFPIWAGWMVQAGERLLLVLPSERASENAARQLFRLGLDNLGGHLRFGMRSWFEAALPIERLGTMSVQELKARLDRADTPQILDVRRDDEWQQGFIPTARHIFAPFVRAQLNDLDRTRTIVAYCSTGYRASIAASMLRQNGFGDVYNVLGSMKAWRAAGYPVHTV